MVNWAVWNKKLKKQWNEVKAFCCYYGASQLNVFERVKNK